MTSVLERSFGILELLAEEAAGLPVGAIANRLGLPPSAAHRLLSELCRFGYVQQDRALGDYSLTIKLASLGLSFLARSGVTDVSQPTLDRLAQATGELIRFSVVDGQQLVWVAVSQGATTGLRYDPGQEQGMVIHLASTAGGRAWLSTLDDEAALTLVARQGFVPDPRRPGPAFSEEPPPATAAELLTALKQTRERGYSIAIDSYIVGMAAMAVPVRSGQYGTVVGAVSIAGPAARLTPERMTELAPLLHAAAIELGRAGEASRYFRRTTSISPDVHASAERTAG